MDVLGYIIAGASALAFGLALLFFLWKFTISALKGEWKKRGIILADTIRKFAKGFCLILGVAMIVACFSYFLMIVGWDADDHYIMLLGCVIGGVVSYPIISSIVLFLAEIFASKLEASIKAGEYAEKIYNQLLKQNGEEVEEPVNTDGMISFELVKKAFLQNKNKLAAEHWFCTACGAPNENNSNFCSSCGKARA